MNPRKRRAINFWRATNVQMTHFQRPTSRSVHIVRRSGIYNLCSIGTYWYFVMRVILTGQTLFLRVWHCKLPEMLKKLKAIFQLVIVAYATWRTFIILGPFCISRMGKTGNARDFKFSVQIDRQACKPKTIQKYIKRGEAASINLL